MNAQIVNVHLLPIMGVAFTNEAVNQKLKGNLVHVIDVVEQDTIPQIVMRTPIRKGMI